MRTSVPEKLLTIVEEIDARGEANLTRLTVLKKWFERPKRLTTFAVWIAARATSRKGKTEGAAADLFCESRALLAGHDSLRPALDRQAAQTLRDRLVAFQNDYHNRRWGPVRIVHNWNLLLVEQSLALYLSRNPAPADGYRLAVDYCQNYDPHYGNSLNGKSSTKILEIVRFMFTLEALEDVEATVT